MFGGLGLGTYQRRLMYTVWAYQQGRGGLPTVAISLGAHGNDFGNDGYIAGREGLHVVRAKVQTKATYYDKNVRGKKRRRDNLGHDWPRCHRFSSLVVVPRGPLGVAP